MSILTDPLFHTFVGTLFTWGFTALGAAGVFVLRSSERKILDGSLGFAAGVMLAASFWSLLEPALESAMAHGYDKTTSFLPVTIGLFAGALFVYIVDVFLPEKDTVDVLLSSNGDHKKDDDFVARGSPTKMQAQQWKRMLLLIIAVTMHNIPEGLAVGVGFGASAQSANRSEAVSAASFANARNLAIGIGIQNFPEGLAVSLPLRAAGFSKMKSFWYGQLSGAVEPIFGLLGCLLVSQIESLLSYALSFAAGAMIYVVFDDIIPESNQSGNGKLASWCAMVGFAVMMALDVGLS